MRGARIALLLVASLTGCTTAKEAPAPEPPRPSRQVPKEPAPPPQPSVLSPEVAPDEELRIQRATQSRIEGAERLVGQIDRSRLVGDQQQEFMTIQTFLAKAKEALSARDMQRAFTLADKAYLLASQLSRGSR